MNHPPEVLRERLAEAARYALLRRLAPALRHDMAGALQPVSMMAAMLEKRLQKPAPDLVALGKNGNAINSLAREAAASCMSLMTWLAPRDDAPVAVNTCIAESLALVATEMSFRGLSLVNQTESVSGMVLLSALRDVFMASLLALTDECEGPANVVLTATTSGESMVIGMHIARREDEPLMAGGTQPAYRKLGWDDVEALAEAQKVGLSHSAGAVELRFPG
ncbi:MAG: hypothetical protein V4573_09235 [Pseudomonadota bacterium]